MNSPFKSLHSLLLHCTPIQLYFRNLFLTNIHFTRKIVEWFSAFTESEFDHQACKHSIKCPPLKSKSLTSKLIQLCVVWCIHISNAKIKLKKLLYMVCSCQVLQVQLKESSQLVSSRCVKWNIWMVSIPLQAQRAVSMASTYIRSCVQVSERLFKNRMFAKYDFISYYFQLLSPPFIQ